MTSLNYTVPDPNLLKQLQLLDADLKSSATKRGAWTGKRMIGVSHNGMHGRGGAAEWLAPRLIVECKKEARPGYKSMSADEYHDEPETLAAKVSFMAKLIRHSRSFCAYTGAGISTASGIDDYASKAKNSVAMQRKKVSGLSAQPTLAHRVMGALYRRGHLKHWVQQNHDGLPQKAGFPPEALNEIHGAWFDPSNPVVPMTGTLRGDLCDWLYEWEQKTDLCLAMGTSLCGMNADRMVETPNDNADLATVSQLLNNANDAKTQSSAKKLKAACLGSIIVGLQRTQHDEACTLRLYATCDEVMALLARELELDGGEDGVRSQAKYVPLLDPAHIISMADDKSQGLSRKVVGALKVPYDKQGFLTQDKKQMVPWDLSPGAVVKVTSGPGAGFVGTVKGRNASGHVQIRLPCQREGSKQHGKEWKLYTLGLWWFETAANGRCARLPVVNTNQKPILPKV